MTVETLLRNLSLKIKNLVLFSIHTASVFHPTVLLDYH